MTIKKNFDGFLSRTFDFTFDEEERADGEATGRKLSGYAAVFNQDTPIRSWEGTFDERMAPGAFSKTLSERKPVMQFDHGRDSRFGSLPIGNFTDVREDGQGLKVEGELFDHAEPIRQAIQSGAVSGMSIKFGVVRDSWTDKNGKEINSKRELQDLLWGDGKDVNGEQRGPLKRTIKEVKLIEAGPVVFPAYTQTSVGVRSTTDQLVDSGYTADEVIAYVARGLPDDDERAAATKKMVKCSTPDCDSDMAPDAEKCPNGHAKPSASDGKRSEDVTSEPETEETTEVANGSHQDADLRTESPDDAAQAGTSTGMSSNARERALALLEFERY